MITKEAIEAAARAMCEAWHYSKIGTPDGDAEWRRKQDQYRTQARAALTAAFAAMPGPAVKVTPLGKEFEEAIFSDVETFYEASALTPAPDLAAENNWTDDDRARAWRESFDSMHQRAMSAEARIAELEKEKHAALTMIAMIEKRLADAEKIVKCMVDWENGMAPLSDDFRAARAYMEGK